MDINSRNVYLIDLIEKILKITSRGNSAEVKQNKDGSFKVYEVRKNAV